jgi:hypothetical protein
VLHCSLGRTSLAQPKNEWAGSGPVKKIKNIFESL